jgi:hypothetical protein
MTNILLNDLFINPETKEVLKVVRVQRDYILADSYIDGVKQPLTIKLFDIDGLKRINGYQLKLKLKVRSR